MFTKIHRGILSLMLLTAGLSLSTVTHAAVLGWPGPLSPTVGVGEPDIQAILLNLDFNTGTYGSAPGSNILKVTEAASFGSFLDAGLVNCPFGCTIFDLDYDLTANLNTDGTLASGTLSIVGSIPDLGISLGTLLTATLTSFGTSYPTNAGDTQGVFEFLATVDSQASGLGFGSQMGIKVIAQSGQLVPDFNLDAFTGNPTSDNFAPLPPSTVPEPGTLALVAVGGLVLRRVTRRRVTR